MGWIDITFLAIVIPPTLAWLAGLLAVLRTRAAIAVLKDTPLTERTTWPRLTVVSPACNEAETLERSLTTLLSQDYPHLDLVAINDRSTDDTGPILDRLAAADPRVVPLHIDALPPGWLGKLNALHHGVALARGDWLLFADADVEYGPGALRRAIIYAETHNLDCLTAIPEVYPIDLLGDAAFTSLSPIAGVLGRPWAVRDPDSDVAAGIGAFILVRREAFMATPGFEWLKLEVADDVGLGLLIKTHGGRCDVVNGRGQIMLQWYDSFAEVADKMQKNWFAIMARFSPARAIALTVPSLSLALFPLAALLPTELPWLPLTVLPGMILALTAKLLFASWARMPRYAACIPGLGQLLVAYMIARSTWIGVKLGGIVWRGQLYRTEVLKGAQRVRF